ncbi:ABC transporter ATP-binding protein [Bradyrhizobium sp. dw_411]|uniref:ABC transporter ATP-binding protein n=1 Tax=Bradyrhizobium sp. dw_411 TaxID=2720082 RepID=UPI001BCF4F2F|nr:ABC transporter ATP-binding protein [Bradyrhizobium sp. dw_411]
MTTEQRGTTDDRLLSVRDLKVTFLSRHGSALAVKGVDFDLARGKVLAIVGESGCGKSATAMSLMHLLPRRSARIEGRMLLRGSDIGALSEAEMNDVRGKHMAIIFQEPMTSLNPLLTIGYQLGEPIRYHLGLDRAATQRRAIELIDLVGIPAAVQIMRSYPHQLSGGMRQRVMIAMALSCDPDILIADEPTTALDVTIQAQIIELLRRIQRRTGMSVIIITHDLGVVSEFADEVIVMYAGRVVESGSVYEVLEDPRHPYTNGLLASIPDIDDEGERLQTIPGNVPNPRTVTEGCWFHPRCVRKGERCEREVPTLATVEAASRRQVACFHPVEHNELRELSDG